MPTSPSGRRIDDLNEAVELLRQIEASGQPLAVWCREHDIQARSLYRCREKLVARGRRATALAPRSSRLDGALRFVELLSSKPLPPLPSRYTLTLPNGVQLEVEETFSDEAVSRLLALASRC